jgi:uncharacterized membrane protein YuzA (DUF378 family)
MNIAERLLMLLGALSALLVGFLLARNSYMDAMECFTGRETDFSTAVVKGLFGMTAICCALILFKTAIAKHDPTEGGDKCQSRE